jgi:hypothetical protein
MAVKIQVEAFWVVTPSVASIFTLKTEAAGTSEMLVSYHNTAWCQNSEDTNFSTSLVITTKQKAKYKFHVASILIFLHYTEQWD